MLVGGSKGLFGRESSVIKSGLKTISQHEQPEAGKSSGPGPVENFSAVSPKHKAYIEANHSVSF